MTRNGTLGAVASFALLSNNVTEKERNALYTSVYWNTDWIHESMHASPNKEFQDENVKIVGHHYKSGSKALIVSIKMVIAICVFVLFG